MIIDLTELKKLTFYKGITPFIGKKEEQIDIYNLIKRMEGCSYRENYSERLYQALKLNGISHNCYYEYNLFVDIKTNEITKNIAITLLKYTLNTINNINNILIII